MNTEIKLCECCKKQEGICFDYRPQLKFLDQGTVFTYSTPLFMYSQFLVCNSCFHIDDDKAFYRKQALNNPEIEKMEAA